MSQVKLEKQLITIYLNKTTQKCSQLSFVVDCRRMHYRESNSWKWRYVLNRTLVVILPTCREHFPTIGNSSTKIPVRLSVNCQYLGKMTEIRQILYRQVSWWCLMIRLPIPIAGLKLCWWTIGRTSITKHWRFLIIWNRFKRSECRATLPGGRPGRQTEGRKERVKYHYNRSTTA